jgi:nitronate monooxygenase
VIALSTEWSRALGLAAPVANAPMGGAAGGALAAAISRAGGLGMIGIGSAGSAARLEKHLGDVAGLDKPFGIGLVDVSMARDPQLLPTAIAARPTVISVSFADRWDWVEQVHDAGIIAVTQIGTLPLLAAVLAHVPIPVLAAGGIATGRGLAAVLAAGAAGAWLGTAFAASAESLNSETTRQALLAALDTDTVLTREFDLAAGYAWPPHLPERVLRNEVTSINAGQGVAALTAVRPAGAIVSELCSEAAQLLGRWGGT